MRQPARPLALALAALPFLTADAIAQREPRPRATIEAYGGISDFGRFLEQIELVDPFEPPFGQRELTGGTSLAIGGSVGIWPWQRTGVRLAFTFAPTELEYQDDSALDREILDRDELADLNAFIFSLEVLRFLLDGDARLAPYATAGITGTIWSLDEESGLIVGGDDDHFRFGGVGGVGLRYRMSRRVGLRIEANTFALGNPFDGTDGFRPTTGLTIDEPSTVRVTRLTLGFTYSFLRRR